MPIIRRRGRWATSSGWALKFVGIVHGSILDRKRKAAQPRAPLIGTEAKDDNPKDNTD